MDKKRLFDQKNNKASTGFMSRRRFVASLGILAGAAVTSQLPSGVHVHARKEEKDHADNRDKTKNVKMATQFDWYTGHTFHKEVLQLGPQLTSIPAGVDAFWLDDGGVVAAAYLWEPSGDFPSATRVVTHIFSNHYSGYDVAVSGVMKPFEFLPNSAMNKRESGDLSGWGCGGHVANNTPNLSLAITYENAISNSSKRALYAREKLAISGEIEILPFVSLHANLLVTDGATKVKPHPNSDFHGHVEIIGASPDLFFIDGTLNDRWYVAEFETKIKARVVSDTIGGSCLVLSGVATSNRRAIISGIEADISLSKMDTACKVMCDNTAYSGAENGNSYVTSNTIKINAAGTRRMVDEYYSNGQQNVRPPKEEIAANHYILQHQPTRIAEYMLLNIVGRMSDIACSFWDSSIPTNSDQINIYGNDNSVGGVNFPARNSGLIHDQGQRTKFKGVTYGTPQDQFSKIIATKSIKNQDFVVGGLLGSAVGTLAINGNHSATATTMLSKTLTIDEKRKPYILTIENSANITVGNSYNVLIEITGAHGTMEFEHQSSLDGHVVNEIEVGIGDAVVAFSSVIAGSGTSSMNSLDVSTNLLGKITINVKCYGSGASNNGFRRITAIKGCFTTE